jgi:hypothetical protein
MINVRVPLVGASFRAFSGRLKFTVRRRKSNKDSLTSVGTANACAWYPVLVPNFSASSSLLLSLDLSDTNVYEP